MHKTTCGVRGSVRAMRLTIGLRTNEENLHRTKPQNCVYSDFKNRASNLNFAKIRETEGYILGERILKLLLSLRKCIAKSIILVNKFQGHNYQHQWISICYCCCCILPRYLTSIKIFNMGFHLIEAKSMLTLS